MDEVPQILSLLLIDDDDDDNYIHEQIIKNTRACRHVFKCNDGGEALEFLSQNNNALPDLIFVDINMPCMGGFEFLEQYQKLIESLKLKQKPCVFMLSSSENKKDREKSQEYESVSGYFVKPLNRQQFINIFKDSST